jgi:hypothetical protein
MGKMAGAERLAVTKADRMNGRDIARLAFSQKPPLESRHQGFRNGVSATRSADQDRVAGADDLNRLVSSDPSHVNLLLVT